MSGPTRKGKTVQFSYSPYLRKQIKQHIPMLVIPAKAGTQYAKPLPALNIVWNLVKLEISDGDLFIDQCVQRKHFYHSVFIMVTATFRFYAELNDFLAPEKRGRDFSSPCARAATTKHMIEALGVPHTEVELVLVHGESAGFDHVLKD